MMRVLKIAVAASVLGAGLLAGCDNGPSAVDTRERAEAAADRSSAVAEVTGAELVAAPVEAPAAMRARWTSNRRHSAEENIQRLFERNGQAFGVSSADDYVAAAHRFIARPPAGTETLRRANGDTLYYHAGTNTFLVANADGVPRTMFKPDDGPGYWQRQRDNPQGSRRGGGEG